MRKAALLILVFSLVILLQYEYDISKTALSASLPVSVTPEMVVFIKLAPAAVPPHGLFATLPDKVFLAAHEDGAVVRASCTLKDVEPVMQSFPGPAVARAGSGVCYGYFERAQAAADWVGSAPRVRR